MSGLSSGLIPLGGRAPLKKDPADLDMDLDMDMDMDLLLDDWEKPVAASLGAPKRSAFSPRPRRADDSDYDSDDFGASPVRKPGLSASGMPVSSKATPIELVSRSLPNSDSVSSSASTVKHTAAAVKPLKAKEDLFGGDEFDDILGDFLAPKKKTAVVKKVSQSVDAIQLKEEQRSEGGVGVGDGAPVRPRTAPAHTSGFDDSAAKLDAAADTEIGFTPSFFEAGRQARSRRQLPKSSTLGELDDILGPSSSADLPARKRIADPFASVTPVSKSLSSLATKPSSLSRDSFDDAPTSVSSAAALPSDATAPSQAYLRETSVLRPDSPEEEEERESHISAMRYALQPSEPAFHDLTIDTANSADSADPANSTNSSSSRKRTPLSVSFEKSVSGPAVPLSAPAPGSRAAASADNPTSTYDASMNSRATEELIQKILKSVTDISLEDKRVFKSEMEEMKRMLLDSANTNSSGSGASSEDLMQARKRIEELEEQVRRLGSDIARLKDEASMSEIQHSEQVKYLKQAHDESTQSREKVHSEAMLGLTRRHDESVASLKKVHLEELAALKERTKDGEALEKLASQIKTTSGSMRLIEEQLAQRHSGLDIAKEGQLEARERLLTEMEGKARERADLAEAESYRLKGLLTHMETVASSLRSQGVEEKERLRQEHQRLMCLQSAVDAERQAMHARLKEDTLEIARKREEANALLRRAEDEKANLVEEMAALRKRMEMDKQEFMSFVARSTSATEAAAIKLKDEEQRLLRLKEDIFEQRNVFQRQKVEASSDLTSAEAVRKELNSYKSEIEREKASLEDTALELKRTSALLHSKDEELQRLSIDIEERERVLREGFQKVSQVGEAVLRRETELSFHSQQLSLQQLELGRMDEALSMKRVSVAAQQREAYSAFPRFENTYESAPPRSSLNDVRESFIDSSHVHSRRDASFGMDSHNDEAVPPENKSSSAWSKLKGMKPSPAGPELKLAKKTMALAKSVLAETSQSRAFTRSFLGNEGMFLDHLKSFK